MVDELSTLEKIRVITGKRPGFHSRLSEEEIAQIEALIEQARQEERERIQTIIDDWDEMGKICDGGETWRVKYNTQDSDVWEKELVQAIRQALKGEVK